MPGMSSIGVQGLLASKSNLDTTSNNIANAETDGYSRQRNTVVDNPSQFTGYGYLGTGVQTNAISRIVMDYLTVQVQVDSQNLAGEEAYLGIASRLDQLLGGDSTALQPALQDFFNTIQAHSDDPSVTSLRQALMVSSEGLVGRFNLLYDQLEQQQSILHQEMTSTVSEINTLVSSVAQLNEQLARYASSLEGQLPNEILDERERSVKRLGELVGISVVPEDNRSLIITTGNGQPLVVGNRFFELSTGNEWGSVDRLDIYSQSTGSSSRITDVISGGKLGGLIQTRNELLDPAFNELGLAALGLADQMNAQHRLGMDLNDALGGDFFSAINDPGVMADRANPDDDNTGTAVLSIRIDDLSLVEPVDYRLEFDGTNYQLFNPLTNATTTFAPAASVALPALGITINAVGAPAAGDRFLVSPSRFAGQEMSLDISRPNEIAAAFPVRVERQSINTGTGYIADVTMSDTTNAAFSTTAGTLTPPVRIEFTSATVYQVLDMTVPSVPVVLAAAVPFLPDQNNDVLFNAGLSYGYEVTLNGAPSTGDQFDISYNAGGAGDNRNALLLQDIQNTDYLSGGSETISDSWNSLITTVATRTRNSEISYSALSVVLSRSVGEQQSISGVNLDEEAANLLAFQQHYEANARVISVANSLFQSLLDAVR